MSRATNWLANANQYNYRNINQFGFKVLLDPTTQGIGNTRVSIPAMQTPEGEARAIDETKLLAPNVAGLQVLQRKQGNLTSEEAAQCWKPANITSSEWAWKRHVPQKNIIGVINHTKRDVGRNIPANSQLRRDQYWFYENQRVSRTEVMKEFTEVFLDLAKSNIGLDLSFSIDQDKMIEYYADENRWRNANASDFIKITPHFNFNFLTRDAIELLLPRRERNLSPTLSIARSQYAAFMESTYFYPELENRRAARQLISPYVSAEDFDIGLSGILRMKEKVARSLSRKIPVLPNNRGNEDIVYSAEGWMNKIRNPDNVVWHNTHNHYCYGELEYAVGTANPRKQNASRLVLKDHIYKYVEGPLQPGDYGYGIHPVGSHGVKLVSPTPELMTHTADLYMDYRNIGRGQSFSPDPTTTFYGTNNASYRTQIPVDSERFLEACRYQLQEVEGKSEAQFRNFLTAYLNESNGATLQRIAPFPYNQSRFLSANNIRNQGQDFCSIVSGGSPQNQGSGLGFSLIDSQNNDLRINPQASGKAQVLYARSSIIVAIDALAQGLRGNESFESLPENSKLINILDRREGKKIAGAELPGLVKQNSENAFVEVILERIVGLDTREFISVINDIENRMKRMNADRDKAIQNSKLAEQQRRQATNTSRRESSIFRRPK
jgi:hypothetical protein